MRQIFNQLYKHLGIVWIRHNKDEKNIVEVGHIKKRKRGDKKFLEGLLISQNQFIHK